jgi:adenylosuccinate synthase
MTTFVVTGIGLGDEGKGTAVDYLSRQLDSPVVIRSTGGPQAAHNVVLPDGRSHTFAQFGSGFLSGAKTIYAAPICDPLAFVKEARALEKYDKDVFKMVSVDANCIVTTPYHQAINRMKEIIRGNNRHGSCGIGINEAVNLASINNIGLCVGDLRDSSESIERRLEGIRFFYERFIFDIVDHFDLDESKELKKIVDFILDDSSVKYVADLFKEFAGLFQIKQSEVIRDDIKNAKNKIFESAQGVLLDPKYGLFFPNVTRLSPFDVLKFLEDKDYHHVLCTRTYMSRHGNGPLISENESVKGFDPDNITNAWQGTIRYGHLDMPSLKYSIDIIRRYGMLVRPKLFVTHTDVINSGKYVSAYNGKDSLYPLIIRDLELQNFSNPDAARSRSNGIINSLTPEYKESDNLIDTIGRCLDVKIGWVSSGRTYRDKKEF